jgi:hypothetical protein
MSLGQSAQNQVCIDVFDDTFFIHVFSESRGDRTLLAETTVFHPGTNTKTAYVHTFETAVENMRPQVTLVNPLVLISIHSHIRSASYVHDRSKFVADTVITPTIVREFVNSIKSSFTSSSTTVFDIEVNGYSTRKPFGKVGKSLGGFVARYKDDRRAAAITEACKTVFKQVPSVVFFIERAVSLMPHSPVPYTLFVLGTEQSEYCVVRDGIVREVVHFDWGTDVLKQLPADLQQAGSRAPQAVIEDFWGAISKSKSELPMPSDYCMILYDQEAHPQVVIEALMSGVYTATGAPMKHRAGVLPDAISARFQSPEMRARSMLDAVRLFSFPL